MKASGRLWGHLSGKKGRTAVRRSGPLVEMGVISAWMMDRGILDIPETTILSCSAVIVETWWCHVKDRSLRRKPPTGTLSDSLGGQPRQIQPHSP